MRVLFTSTPAVGHVHPMVPLARAFREQGDRVSWTTAATVCPALVAEGFEAFPAGSGADESRQQFYDQFPEHAELTPAEGPAFMFPRLFGTIRAPRMLDELMPIVRKLKPDVIVHDANEFAGPIAAAVAGVPSVTHSFGALSPVERVAAAGDAVAPLWEANGLTPCPYAGNYEFLYLDIYPRSLRSGSWDHVPRVQPLRPVGFALPGDEPVPQWPAQMQELPLVYVTFGTVFNRDISAWSRVVAGLRDLPVRLIVTVGPSGDPSALGPQPVNVHVARYIPQSQVLGSASAVVSHAGSGTFLATLARGLPQLCLPQGADQFGNASACSRAGAGLEIQPGDLTTDSVRDAASRLFAEPEFRSRARQLADEIAQMPTPDTVAAQIRTTYKS